MDIHLIKYTVYKCILPLSWLPFCFAVQNLFNLLYSHVFFFAFVSLTWGDISKKILLRLMWKSICLCCLLSMFSFRSLMVLSLTFNSLIYFEFIFVYGGKECSRFILSHVAVRFSEHHLMKRFSFSHFMFLPPFS